jgi:hypothetical protein
MCGRFTQRYTGHCAKRNHAPLGGAINGNQNRNHAEPVWDANDSAIAREFETLRKMFETYPTNSIEAAALFECLAQPLCADDDFTVIEHAVELWKGGGRGRYFPLAKVWAAQMAAALKRIAASSGLLPPLCDGGAAGPGCRSGGNDDG